ncbi:MAG: hypothetical protein HS111_30710 [Kofleriaceae bacterium]|nr:hypothetical protein [Kofleriaceae bacterium]MCL4226404.1 hypothetical protein [Myxococcales bacterium]
MRASRSIPVLFAALVALAAAVGAGCAAESGDDLEELADIATTEDPIDTGKADAVDLALTPLELPAPAGIGDGEVRLLIRSNLAYRALFGADAPPVDFSRRWVVYYSPGVQPTGGHLAAIDRIWTTYAGQILRVATRHEAPGADCRVTFALSRPRAAVSFPKPRRTPSLAVAHHQREVRSCAPPCRAIAPTDLATLDLSVTGEVRAIYFVPRDRPFRECLGERLDTFATLARDFFRDEMAAEGYRDAGGAGKTFTLDADPAGRWNVVYMIGREDAAWYQAQPDPPGAAMAEMFARVPAAFHERNVTLYLYDLAEVSGRRLLHTGNAGSGAPWEGPGSGYVLQGAHFLGVGFDTLATDPAEQAAMFEQGGDAGVDDWNGDQVFGPLTRGQYASTYVGAALHELGHAFYLEHTFVDHDGDGIETNLMGNGFRRLSGRYSPNGYQPATRLGPDSAAALDGALLFNP